MKKSNIQREILSKLRNPMRVPNYKVNRERCQANQQEIIKANNTTICSPVSNIKNNKTKSLNKKREQLRPQQRNKQCWIYDN